MVVSSSAVYGATPLKICFTLKVLVVLRCSKKAGQFLIKVDLLCKIRVPIYNTIQYMVYFYFPSELIAPISPLASSRLHLS
jgi:hypothetical protein